MADARMGRSADTIAVGETLLGIVGGDPQNIQRKNLPSLFAVPLPVKITMFSNEIPVMFDSSGALANRFLTLRMTRSFLGAEDIELKQRLRAELPGILNWAVAGLRDLQAAGKFREPESSQQLARDIAETYAPIRVFVRDRCRVDPYDDGSLPETSKSELYAAWKMWCDQQGIDRPGTMAIFFRNLYAAYPGITEKKRRAGGSGQWPTLDQDHGPPV